MSAVPGAYEAAPAGVSRPGSHLSVIVPLVDHRDQAERCLDLWLGQVGAEGAVEIVLVAGGALGEWAGLQKRLRTSDQLVRCDGGDEIVFYAAGAAAARGDILLFTESHCLPRQAAAAGILAHLARDPGIAAWVAADCVTSSRLGRLEARLYANQRRERPADDDWRHVSLRGFAVRRCHFAQAGGFPVAYGRFAEAVLARELQRLGLALTEVPGPLFSHVNCTSFSDLSAAVRAHGRGQTRHREDAERGDREPLLPPWGEWSGRARRSARVARHAAKLLLSSLGKDRQRAGGEAKALYALKALPPLLPALASGPRASLLAARLQARFSALAVHLSRGHRQYLHYVRLWTAFLAVANRQYLLEEPSALAGPLAAGALLRPAELPDGALFGFHAPERWPGGTCRWSSPCAVVRLDLAPGDYRLILDLLSPLPLTERCLTVFFDGRRLPWEPRGEAGNGIVCRLERGSFAAGTEHHLGITCAPFHPRESGLDDDRELGEWRFLPSLSSRWGADLPTAVQPARRAPLRPDFWNSDR